jgi:hypothetical protein
MKQLLATITLVSFITIGGFGFMHANQMTERDHMRMTPCPFMQGYDVICSMNALGHIKAWQHAFTSTVSNFSVLLSLLAISIIGFFTLKVHRPPDKDKFRIKVRERFKNTPTLYQLLFSRGILNPKTP